MCVHDVPTFEAMQFALLLDSLWKKFPRDLQLDTEPGRQATHDNFANVVIKGTYPLRSHKFILWVYNELSLDLG